MVTAKMPPNRKGIPMRKHKFKRHTTLHSTADKTGGPSGPNGSARTAAGKTINRKVGAQSVVGRQRRSPTKPVGRAGSKQARIIAMLRSASGATIQAMTDATGWQQHSVRGFLAGVVRKRLGLTLISAAAEGGRIYRIVDHTDARAEATPATKRA